MKHPLIRRCPLLTLGCILILAFMLVPMAVFAMTAAPSVAGEAGTLSLATAGIFGMPMLLRDEEGDQGGGGGGQAPTPAEALATLEDRTLPMSQRLSAAIQSLRGIDPTGQLANVTKERDEALATLKLRESELAKAKDALAASAKEITALTKDVEEAQAAAAAAEKTVADLQAKEQDLEKRASEKSKEGLRSLGFPASNLPSPSTTTTGSTLEDLRTEFKAETDPLKKGKLASRIRDLEAKAAAPLN